MAKNRRPDRPRDKAHGIDGESLQCADERIGLRKIELRENEPGDRAVDKEIVPLDRRADRAGDDRSAQLGAVLDIGQRDGSNFSCSHLADPPVPAA